MAVPEASRIRHHPRQHGESSRGFAGGVSDAQTATRVSGARAHVAGRAVDVASRPKLEEEGILPVQGGKKVVGVFHRTGLLTDSLSTASGLTIKNLYVVYAAWAFAADDL